MNIRFCCVFFPFSSYGRLAFGFFSIYPNAAVALKVTPLKSSPLLPKRLQNLSDQLPGGEVIRGVPWAHAWIFQVCKIYALQGPKGRNFYISGRSRWWRFSLGFLSFLFGWFIKVIRWHQKNVWWVALQTGTGLSMSKGSLPKRKGSFSNPFAVSFREGTNYFWVVGDDLLPWAGRFGWGGLGDHMGGLGFCVVVSNI